jgi:hypothetical protein
MKRISAWLYTGMLLGAFCLNAHVARAQCFPPPGGSPKAPAVADNASYTSGYITCSNRGFTARVWLDNYFPGGGWKRILGQRDNACSTLPTAYLDVYGDTLNFATGAFAGAYRFAAAPWGCTGGTVVSYTLTNSHAYFYNRSCGLYYGTCQTSVGSAE